MCQLVLVLPHLTQPLGINVRDMEEHQKKALEDLVQEFSDVFSTSKQDVARPD